MKEIEAKIKIDDLFYSKFKKLNLKLNKRVKVLDIYFKMKNDEVLRLRKENDIVFIAYKTPREKHKSLIIREEYEIKIESFKTMKNILEKLGYKINSKAEKIREYYKFNNLIITIDEYPFIGKFIEIEGDEDKVLKFCKQNNLSKKQFIQKNCTELFLDHIKKNNLKFEKDPKLHFTFKDEKIDSNKIA